MTATDFQGLPSHLNSNISAMSSLYETLPKGHIRLLRLHELCLVYPPEAAEKDFSISCRLETVCVDESVQAIPTYAALSYCWGDISPTFRRHLLCNGKLVPVTTNLFNALYQIMRNPGLMEMAWWVDAICINQEDLQEKSVQVARMGLTYSKAELVAVWLGNGAESTAGTALFDFLQQMQNHPSVDILEPPTYLSNNMWLHRAWCLQEIILAREAIVLCGPFVIEWDVFRRAKGLRELTTKMQALRNRSQPCTVAELLRASSGRASADPRDRFYSLLGIYQADHGTGFIVPNYTEDILDVSLRVGLKLLDEEQYLFFVHMLPELDYTEVSEIRFFSKSEDWYICIPETSAKGRSWLPNPDNLKLLEEQEGYLGKHKGPILRFDRTHPTLVIERGISQRQLVVTGAILGWTTWRHHIVQPFKSFAPCIVGAHELSLARFVAEANGSKPASSNFTTYRHAQDVYKLAKLHDDRKCACLPQNHTQAEGEKGWTLWLCALFGADALAMVRPCRRGDGLAFRLVGPHPGGGTWARTLLNWSKAQTPDQLEALSQAPRWAELGSMSWIPSRFKLE